MWTGLKFRIAWARKFGLTRGSYPCRGEFGHGVYTADQLMNLIFESSTSAVRAKSFMSLERQNPFCGTAYGRAMRAHGSEPWILGVVSGGNLISGCCAFLSEGRLNRLLSIP